jgi:excisionase family DNA binding protein
MRRRTRVETNGGSDFAQSVVDALASAPDVLNRLRELLVVDESPPVPAYTVHSLAVTLGVSAKSIRNAIARRELRARKQGGRWIISAAAVEEWSRPADERRFARRSTQKCNKPLTNALDRFDRQVSSRQVPS